MEVFLYIQRMEPVPIHVLKLMPAKKLSLSLRTEIYATSQMPIRIKLSCTLRSTVTVKYVLVLQLLLPQLYSLFLFFSLRFHTFPLH